MQIFAYMEVTDPQDKRALFASVLSGVLFRTSPLRC